MLDFKRLELLSDESLGMNLQVFIFVTWIIQALIMIYNYQRCMHRKRYPVVPGIVGTVLKAASIGCLLIPKMVLASTTLLNAIYLHPFLYLSNTCVSTYLIRSLLRKDIGFDIILISTAPVHIQMEDRRKNMQGNENAVKRMVTRLFPLLIQTSPLLLYFSIGLILFLSDSDDVM